MATWLVAQGHQVRVVTAPPYYPAWAVSPGYSGRSYQRSVWHGATVLRCPLWVPRQPGGVKRLLHLASFALSSLPVMLGQVAWRPQVVWVVEPALFCAPTAVLVARLCGAKAWLHVQDFEVDAAFSLGLLRGERVRAWVTGFERWLMRRFDVVSTISRRMHALLLLKGVLPAKAEIAPNWVDLEAITPSMMAALAPAFEDDLSGGLGTPQEPPNRFRAQLGIAPTTVVALYSGNMGTKQGLDLLSDAATLLAQAAQAKREAGEPFPEIVLVLCGNGAGRADLVQRCAGLPNVHFLDLQPLAHLSELLGMADVHMLPQRADAADLVMPSKLIGMLASGRPVLATAHAGTELAHVVQGAAQRNEPCGMVVPPAEPLAFADALFQLALDPDTRYLMGEAARRYAEEHLHVDAVLGRFADRLALEVHG
jgi:colanic acid biosynthesis glycosyl transferase WcaI